MFDTNLFLTLHSLANVSTLLDGAVVFCAVYLAYVTIALFLFLLARAAYPRRDKIEILLVVGFSALIARFGVTQLIRYFIHRPRPFVTLPIHPLFTDSAWSFPSGHATFFFALATAVYLYNKRWGRGFLALAALISLARVVAGVHYPSDIVAGALIGAAVAWLIYKLIFTYAPRTANQRVQQVIAPLR